MMTTTLNKSALVTALLAMSLAAAALLPAPASAANAPPTASAPADTDTDADTDATNDRDSSTDDDDAQNWTDARHAWNQRRHHDHTNDIVAVGHDSNLPAGAQADSVVAVFGSATNNGTAREDVVSVFGDTTVNGPVTGSAVAVLGNNVINADVGQDVVAVLGSVTLGPNAHVHGHVVSVLGTVTQDPAAIVDQGIQRVLPESIATAAGLRVWLGHGLMFGRPLVFGTGTQWLWGIAFTFLAVYTLLALLFRDAAEHCIETLNEHPGKSLITAILAVLLTPLLLLLLVITVVGVLAIPIAMVMLFCAAIFGKTTVLGWIGGRCFGLRPGQIAPHPALAVIVGGLLVMLAYLVPLLGFVVFILLGMLGYGAVLYSIFMRIRHTTRGASSAGPSGSGGAAPFAAAPAAAAAAAAAAPGAAFAASGPEAAAAAGPGPSAGPGLSSAHAAPAAAPAAATVPLSTYPRAGFWIRMGALFIDTIIVSVLLGLVMGVFGHEDQNRIWLLGLATYGAVMWKFKGTTIGGALLHLQVTRLDSRPLDWPTVWVRALGCILSLCALCLGFIWISVDPERQGWHDKLAGTIVVRTPKGIPLV
jgi:uncharacterized RDD family membrane protein YckC